MPHRLLYSNAQRLIFLANLICDDGQAELLQQTQLGSSLLDSDYDLDGAAAMPKAATPDCVT